METENTCGLLLPSMAKRLPDRRSREKRVREEGAAVSLAAIN